MSRVLAVIPARWASTRFPGKMLHPLCGRPLLGWVIDRVRQARRVDGVLVATDDARIAALAAAMGVEAVHTDPALRSGTDRVAAAVRGRGVEAVVNVQGDEPLIDPGLVDALADVVATPRGVAMATAAAPLADVRSAADPSVVKVVCDRAGRALYFSRAAIPHLRDGGKPPCPYLRHIGIYAYRTAFLRRFVAAPPCALEQAEELEQLRALYLGARIRVLSVAAAGPGVDTPADVVPVEAALHRAGLVPSGGGVR